VKEMGKTYIRREKKDQRPYDARGEEKGPVPMKSPKKWGERKRKFSLGTKGPLPADAKGNKGGKGEGKNDEK